MGFRAQYILVKPSTELAAAFPNRVFQKQVTGDPEWPVLSKSLSIQFGQGQTGQVQILTQSFTFLLILDLVYKPP